MSDTKPAPFRPYQKPRPAGLLVEDRNAVVQTNETGAQHIVKTPSREEEAKRQGVDESQI